MGGCLVEFPSFKLEYSEQPHNINDSEWEDGSPRRSTTGDIFRYKGAPIHGKTKLHKTTALSTAEAEHYGSIDSGGGSRLPSPAPQEYGIRAGGVHARLGVEQQRPRGT